MKIDNNLLVEDFYKKSFVIPDGSNLTPEQSKETLETYESSAEKYSIIEWATYSCIKSSFDTRRPFVKKLLENNIEEHPILVLGCGSGRDTFYLLRSLDRLGIKNTPIFGLDYSKEMVKIAKRKVLEELKKNKITAKVLFKKSDLRVLDSNFEYREKFGSIFCESALSHISFEEIDKTLQAFRFVLRKDGIAFLGFRLRNDDESNVYSTEGDFGRRHYLRISLGELSKLLFENKFEIIWGPKVSNHPDGKRPPFINVIVRKVL